MSTVLRGRLLSGGFGRLPFVSGIVVAGAVLLFVPPASAPSAATLAVVAPAPLPRVTLISDSVAASIAFDTGAKAILAEGIDLYLEPGQGRMLAGEDVSPAYAPPAFAPPTAIQLIRTLGRRLGPTVIMSVGHNDFSDQYGSNMEVALAALERAGVERVLWVTLHVSEAHTSYLIMNNAIADAATRHPELTVVDWNAYATGHPEWVGADPHIFGGGMRAMARLFHQSLESLGIPAR